MRYPLCLLTWPLYAPVMYHLAKKDIALRNELREKGASLAEHMGDEKIRRFFWGLGLETEWNYALPLANAILRVFGVKQG